MGTVSFGWLTQHADGAWKSQVCPILVVDHVFPRKTSSHAFVQLGEQLHRITIRLAEYSELISTGCTGDQLERLDDLACRAEPLPDVQHTWSPVAVGERDGLKPRLVDLDPHPFRGRTIETRDAERLRLRYVSEMNGVVGWYSRPAAFALACHAYYYAQHLRAGNRAGGAGGAVPGARPWPAGSAVRR